AATLWIGTSLLDQSLAFTATNELDQLSKSLEQTAREFYQQARENLKTDAIAGRLPAVRYASTQKETWPMPVKEFGDSEEFDIFALSTAAGACLNYLVGNGDDVLVYSRPLGTVRMGQIRDQYRRTREIVADSRERDLRRGLTVTLIVLVVAVWIVALISLVF